MIVLEMSHSHIHVSVNELPLGQKFQWEVITRGLFNSPLLLKLLLVHLGRVERGSIMVELNIDQMVQ